MVAFYRVMDAGDAAIQAFQSTASETVVPSPVPLMPRYVRDYLKKQCAAQSRAPQGARRGAEFPEGGADVECIARSNSRERLTQFAKLCPNDCDPRALFRDASARVRALLPGEAEQQQQPPGRPSPPNRGAPNFASPRG